MINLAQLNQTQILLFALVLLRCSTFVMTSAVFSSSSIPVHFKILFSLVFSMLMFPLISSHGVESTFIDAHLIELVIREVLVGLVMGFMTRMFFFAVSMIGDLLSISLGLSAAQMYNPLNGGQSQIMDQFFTWVSLMIFLALGGHHILINALASSFSVISIAQNKFSTGLFAEVVVNYYKLLIISIQIAAPILVAMLLTNLAMGILGRTVPQINVLVTSFPVTIMLGLTVLILILPMWSEEMSHLLDLTSTQLLQLMKAI